MENIKDIKDIRVGDTYYVRVKVTAKAENHIACRPLILGATMSGFAPIFFDFEVAEAFYKSILEQPKHDPCRKFRKGDKVELKEEIDGRKLSEFVTGLTLGKIYTVEEDEKNHIVVIDSDNGLCRYSFVHLELVTPVEEVEPYEVDCDDDEKEYSIVCRHKFVCVYPYDSDSFYTKEEACERAEAECARLNSQHRKEMNND